MRWSDILAYCFINMKQRKLRTFLTVLAVAMGITSVTAFLSIAIGYRQNVMKEFSGENDATMITVTSKKSGNVQKEDLEKMLTEDKIAQIEGMKHVAAVRPELTFQSGFSYGKYSGSIVLTGVDSSRLSQMKLQAGRMPELSSGLLEMILCGDVKKNMYYSEGNKIYDYTVTGELPKISFQKDLREISLMNVSYTSDDETEDDAASADENARTSFVNSATTKRRGSETSDKTVKHKGYDAGFAEDALSDDEKNDLYAQKDTSENVSEGDVYVPISVRVTGIIDASAAKENGYSGQGFADIVWMKKYLLAKFGKGNIPGQPRVDGHQTAQWCYTSAKVTADSLDHVSAVVKKLKKMGFKTENNKALLEAAQKNIRNAGVVFAGVGLTALLVATIGIANTMFMAILEREKTIAMIKVLGGRPADILKIFLVESAVVGALGGFAGEILCVPLSLLVNDIAVHRMNYGQAVSVLYAPLMPGTLVFAVFIGVASGYLPARKAMRTSVTSVY